MRLREQGALLTVDVGVSRRLALAGILKALEPRPVIFERVLDAAYPVVGNLFCSKERFASYLGVTVPELIPRMLRAIDERSKPEEVKTAPCQEVVESHVDLDQVPLLLHSEREGGFYISSAVVVSGHPEYGQNLDFHRAMQFGKDTMSVRVVARRDFDTFLSDLGEVDVAFCIGNPANILAAAATSVDIGINELEIANALEPIRVVKAKTSDLLIPADCEWVLEGRIYLDDRHDEGPFIDITDTYDVVRNEPVLKVKCITHRKNPIWQALLPGALEHKLLMGMPREPTIFKKVQEAGVKVLDVHINPGGCSWLHALVQIDKKQDDDGKLAIEAAFQGHRSCKHVFVVDKDIDIYDPIMVEWALATRFQGDNDLIIKDKERGSSLDPSAEPGTYFTTKLGFDMTAPLRIVEGKTYERATFPRVDLVKYIKDSE